MRLTAALGALVFALSGCAHVPQVPSGARYVALGSSYAAGTGIGGIKPDTPQRCARSPLNYATLLASRLDLMLDDQTCGGATTANILGPWGELPAQIDAVNAQTRLVTVTIGGNDVGYVMNLFAASCRAEDGFTLEGVKRPCPSLRPPTASDYARLETGLRQIAQEVARRAPQARLIFVQYVSLVPSTPCAALSLSPEGAVVTREIGQKLAEVTARAAKAEGAEVLSVNVLSYGHTPCDAQPWSVGPQPLGAAANTPWHPNAAGHAAIAASLAKLLKP